jgi:hypothetical protein
MANINAIPINLDGELAESIMNLIDRQGYGYSTYLVKEFMEKHKDELIGFWNGQGKDGSKIYEKWFKKWSMTKAEQESVKAQKEKETHDKLVKSYLALNYEPEKAEELANAFPDKDPIEVVKILNYHIQNKPIEEREHTKKIHDFKAANREIVNQAIGLKLGLQKQFIQESEKKYLEDSLEQVKAKLKSLLDAEGLTFEDVFP